MPSPVSAGLYRDEDAVVRCRWCQATAAYRHYHDHEWGFPVTDDRRLFEKICLEGFQAGLSWLTILNKREAFRQAFARFDAAKVARFTDEDIDRLVNDAGIVRHRGKIVSTINNAHRALAIKKEFGSFAAYVWRFEPAASTRPKKITAAALAAQNAALVARPLARDLKQRGFTFVGETTVYAFMQAMGLVNDHLEGCSARQPALEARAALTLPVAKAPAARAGKATTRNG